MKRAIVSLEIEGFKSSNPIDLDDSSIVYSKDGRIVSFWNKPKACSLLIEGLIDCFGDLIYELDYRRKMELKGANNGQEETKKT